MNQNPIYRFTCEEVFVSDLVLGYEWHEKIDHIQHVIAQEEKEDLSSTLLQYEWVQSSISTPLGIVINTYKNGFLHGPKRHFYRNSELSTEIWYKEGKKHGRFFCFHPKTGVMIRSLPYFEDEREEKGIYWDENGALLAEIGMKKNQYHGTLKTYHPIIKNVMRSQEWKAGIRDGIDSLYHEDDGFLLFCDLWKKGVKTEVFAEDLLEKNLHREEKK